jgi:hypothetical protein
MTSETICCPGGCRQSRRIEDICELAEECQVWDLDEAMDRIAELVKEMVTSDLAEARREAADGKHSV